MKETSRDLSGFWKLLRGFASLPHLILRAESGSGFTAHAPPRMVPLDRKTEDTRLSAPKPLARILTTRSADGIELAIATEDGQTLKVLATEDQIDRLVDELEDVLNSPRDEE